LFSRRHLTKTSKEGDDGHCPDPYSGLNILQHTRTEERHGRSQGTAFNLLHLPTLTGGVGAAAVRRFYSRYFIGKWPADTKVVPVSRTVGRDQVVDELIVSFTHDVPLEFALPGIKPTGKHVELPHVVVMKFENGKIAHEHIYWDQASLLVQVGLLDPKMLPAVGVEQARTLLDKSQPLNTLMKTEH